MTLLELCEPFFQYVCRLNRSARKGVRFEPAAVRTDLKSMLSDMRQRASGTPGLADQFDRIELVLIYFADFMIKESRLDFARKWEELAHERNELAGDEAFFDVLDETLADNSERATERLAVFYTCLGLGFTGFYTGQPEYLRKKMMEISARIRTHVDKDDGSKICPEAYEHTSTADLIEPPGRSLVGIGIALAGLIVVLIALNVFMYQSASKELLDAMGRIIRAGGGA
ncbi:MAG: DotU family type IV/VI secretion system protein [Phycisphaeraceae bacterium]|nr:DotU family type IV/VI secretion system protein [Phycisphaeraceae bacterium]MCW5768023.1 DotU family type IV/VI secretion system protein [Phycisphaeraceae bacterium]